jgi:hypothetical protein
MVRIYEVWTVTEKGVLVHGGGRGEGTGSHKGEDGKRARANSSQLALRQVHSGIGAGLAGAKKEGEEGLEPGQVLHGWECVAQLRHEGVWKVEWIRNGEYSISVNSFQGRMYSILLKLNRCYACIDRRQRASNRLGARSGWKLDGLCQLWSRYIN